MKRSHSRFLSALLTLVLVLPLFPVPARAADLSGQCGENAYWNFADGVLTISGTGPMDNYKSEYGDHAPWKEAGLIGDEGGIIDALVIEPGITTIGDNAFNEVWFTTASIPNTVTYIGEEAFYGNRSLTGITIPESVTYIGPRAFDTCMALSSAVVNAKITILEPNTFAGCVLLSNVKLPNTLTSIGSSAFNACKSLRSIVIPEGVTTIDSLAFRDCSNLSSISLPRTLQTIEARAFSGNESLTEITIPENVRYIGEFVFCDTLINESSSLNTVTFQGDAPELDMFAFHDLAFNAYYPQDKNWPESIFRNHDHITWIPYGDTADSNKCGENLTWNLENGILTISGTGAMTDFDAASVPWNSGKSQIHTVNMDAGVTHIGTNAFSGCVNLTAVTMPTALTTIGASSFAGCAALTRMTILNGTTVIGDNAFTGCQSMTELSIPNTVTTIGASAFAGCAALPALTIPDSVTTIGDSAFSGCTALASVALSKNLTSLGNSAFAVCSTLKSVTIPGSLGVIPEDAFYRCFALESVTIQEGVTAIGTRAFTTAYALTSLSLPQSLQTIGTSAFEGCRSLPRVTIPENVTSIRDNAFYFCDSLTEITFQGDAPELQEKAFYYEVRATAYYPAYRTWPQAIRDQHAYLTWVPYGEAAPDLSPLTSGWITRISLSAADLGVDAPDATLQAITYFQNDGTCLISWDPVDLTALQMFFHNMFVNSYYAMAYGAGITDINEMERICMETNGMGVSDYMSTIVTMEAIWNAFVPADASGTYTLNEEKNAVYTNMPFMGVSSDPSIPNSFTFDEYGYNLYLNAASYGKPDYTFVYSRIVN